MSSSCVPPKNCVVHDPDPGSHDHDDARSECGSLCTCTSSSMTSIATSVSRDPRGSSASLSPTPTSGTPAQSVPNSPQVQQGGENPFIVVFVPPQMLSNRQGCGTCGSCHGQAALKVATRAGLKTLCEFCPWVAGFIIIYYTFWWWGLGAGFSAFLLMMGAHACIRLLRLRSSPDCPARCSRRHSSEDSGEEEEEGRDEEDDRQDEQGEEEPQAPPDIRLENPPSYEAALVKPPPYDLYHHLTPTQPRSALQAPPMTEKKQQKSQYLGLPDLGSNQLPNSLEDDEDVFLPSYQEAIRLSFSAEKESDGKDE